MKRGTRPLVLFDDVALRSPGGRIVFAGAAWSLPRGARVRIGGASGNGATALLRLCAGLAHPQSGRVVLDGVPHDSFRFDHPFLRRGAIGWVPQAGDLIANLTLLQNVALPLRFVSGRSRDEAAAAALAMLARLGMAKEALLGPHALGRRQRQLAAFARSSAGRPELWLVDRLFDDLDADQLGRAIAVLAEALDDPGVTLLLVGDGPECERLAPSVVRLDGGLIISEERT
jgi:ABC-type lipoprotein export system ATPase subunit